MKRILASAILAFFLSGCLGQNALFNGVQDWNATATNNKFVNQGISFVFWWLPVYSLTLLGDIVIFNSIEFWSGENILSKKPAKVAGTTERLEDGLGNHADVTYNADGSVTVLAYANGQQHSYRLVRDGDEVIKLSDDGEQVLGALQF